MSVLHGDDASKSVAKEMLPSLSRGDGPESVVPICCRRWFSVVAEEINPSTSLPQAASAAAGAACGLAASPIYWGGLLIGNRVRVTVTTRQSASDLSTGNLHEGSNVGLAAPTRLRVCQFKRQRLTSRHC